MKKERPILFSTPMVQAVLNGTKTQTRRVVKVNTHAKFDALLNVEFSGSAAKFSGLDGDKSFYINCPYGKVGDELWVRETFFPTTVGYSLYKADAEGDQLYLGTGDDGPVYAPVSGYKWKSSIFMPRDESRIQLRITDIRVERLQDISEEAAQAEGIIAREGIFGTYYKDYLSDSSGYGNPDYDFPTVNTAKDSFHSLWDSINGDPRKDGVDISWNANPWVWVVEFEKIKP